MRLRLFEFVVHEAILNLRRNGLMTIAAVTTVAISLTILGMFAAAILSLDALANSLPTKLDEIAVFLKDGIDSQDKLLLQSQIKKIPGVTSVELISKEAAWPKFKESLGEDIELGDMKNPLPDAFRIKIGDPRMAEPAAGLIGKMAGVSGVKYGKAELRVMLTAANVIRVIGIAAGIFMVVGICLIISNAIRLTVFARRREIRVMQLVGATSWLIRMPFVLEGIFHGLVGGLVAAGVLLAGINYVSSIAHGILPFLPQMSKPVEMNSLCLALLVFGMVLGAAGSFISLRRFLKI